MTPARLVAQGFRSMMRYKLRTSFMMLGSLVGVAALSFVMSVGAVARTKMLATISQIIGDQAILVAGGGSRMTGSPRPGASRLTVEDMQAVVAEVPGIETWDPQAELRLSVRHDDASVFARVLGSTDRWERVWGRGVASGESFAASDVAGSARVAIIGATVVQRLFADQDPVGAEIRIGNVAMTVIGVLEPFGIDTHGMDRDNEIVVPISTLMRRLSNVDAINTVKFLMMEGTAQDEAAREIARVLRARHGLSADQPDDFRIVTALEAQQMMRMIERVLLLYLPLVGGIALVVGGVVAATLMLASVNERVAEIGLRRAVGASPEDIRWQFLLETAAISLTGAAGGVVLGYIGARLAANQMQLDGAFSWTAVLVSLVAAVLVGLLAGVAPARRAALLHPAQALR
jgi:putative ABC transport system permease protein